MAESTLSHLDYGHAGVATFDLDRREWLFARQFTTTTGPLKQVGIQNKLSIEAVPASIQFPNPRVSTRITDANTNIKVLGRAHPQLVPASDLLPELAVTSAAVLSVTLNYDPLVGNLFSTGSLTYQTGSDKWGNPRRVAAMVAGEAGNILCLKLLFKETMGWGSDKSVWIKGNTLRDTDCGYWNEEAAAIQQVCFAQSEDRSTLLAVRLPTKTVIFRPFYSQDPQPARPSPYYHLPSSLLDAHPILRLDIDQSGGSPHVDVTFNPDFQLQFAVVDQNHVWSIWDIDHGRKGDEYKLSCLVQGYVAPSVDTDLTGEDGWARILWVGDVNTILVCTRRQLSIVGIMGGSFTYLSCPSLLTQRSSDWILDVKRHPLLRSRFFLLTSTQLYFMSVTTSSEALDANADVVGARVLICWSHYRDAEDFTLSISVQMLDDDGMHKPFFCMQALTDYVIDVCVLLHSRLNNLTQNYTFRNSSLDSTTLISSPNPTLLDLATDGAGRTIQIHVEPCPFQGDTSANVSGLGRSYLAQEIHFYKSFMLQSDLSVHETILCARVFADGGLTENHDAVESVSWTIAYRPRRDVRTIRDIKEMDNFIESEEIEIKEHPTSKLLSQGPKWAESKTLGTAYRLIDHKFVYDILTQRDSDKELTAENVEVPLVTTRLKQLLARNSDLMQLPLGTL
jgi:RNA polymerase I-specific transcription initiation factor RRN6